MKVHNGLKLIGTTLLAGFGLFFSIWRQPGGGRVPPPREDDGLYGVPDLLLEFKDIRQFPPEVFQEFGEAVKFHRQGNLEHSLQESSGVVSQNLGEALKRYQRLQNVSVAGEPTNLAQISVVVTHNVGMLYASAGETELARQFLEFSKHLNGLRKP